MPHRWSELPPADVLRILEDMAARDGTAMSGFLDTHQWVPLSERGLSVWGGHENAQQRRAGIGATPSASIAGLNALPPEIRNPRMLRSWLYKSGVPDGSLGDIVIATNGSWLAVTETQSLAAAGLDFAEYQAWEPAPGKLLKATAAGARADAVVAAVFNVSRGEAQTALKYGFVFANFHSLSKQTHEIRAGDQLVYRTKGRTQIHTLSEHTRSGRLWVEYELFPA